MTEGPAPTTFRSAAAFRAWLQKRHARVEELLVRCFKNHAAARGLTYRQALDEALCFGWIDGVRRSLDADSFSVRFTPRREKSRWSAVNVARVRALIAEGRMAPSGRRAFEKRGDGGTRAGYSYESRPRALAPAYLRALRASPRAFASYAAQPPWYRRTTAFWVMSAKHEETRRRRLSTLIACHERGQTLPQLTRTKTARGRAG
jgi:uncharacterized protein YdeI (YjbR/CyaY-like superfamily)